MGVLGADLKKLDELGYKYDILDPEVVLIHDFILPEECKILHDYSESVTQEQWIGAYIDGIKKRTENRYGDEDLEAHNVEVTTDWNDKVVYIYDVDGIKEIAGLMLNRIQSFFTKDAPAYFRAFGIIQRQYTGSELRGHYDQYVDARMQWAAVAYFNDNYTDGEFYFAEKGIVIKPKPGDLLIFPATEEYWHGVKEVGPGPTRYAMPTFIWNDPDAF